MDRAHASQDFEKSIVSVLASMKCALSKTENTCFMGASRKNIDVSFTSFSESAEYSNLFKFIHENLENLIVPINTGVYYLLFIYCLL